MLPDAQAGSAARLQARTSALAARANLPPLRPRLPLRLNGDLIGSVELAVLERIAPAFAGHSQFSLRPEQQGGTGQGDALAWHMEGPATPALAFAAEALRMCGLAGAWRNELLAVTNQAGQVIASIERAATRPLGIATQAVHLVGFTPDGRMWLQQRALTKPNDPGLWDTLVGGMVPAGESLLAALERETWEEAGLRLAELPGLAHGGQIACAYPSGDCQGTGYLREVIDWYSAVVPPQLTPVCQDGEVEQFEALAPAELMARMDSGCVTFDAARIILTSLLKR